MLDKLVVKLLVLKMWLSDEHGQDVTEYALLTGGIALILVTAVGLFSGVVQTWFGDAADYFTTNFAP